MKRLIALTFAALLCAGCSTGIGRAFSTAVHGTPSEVAEAVQFMDQTMARELRMKYESIDEAPVINPDGQINRTAAEYRFRDLALTHAEIEHWEALSKALADYLDIDLDRKPSTSEKEADKRRKELWKALGASGKKVLDEIREDSDD